MDQDFEAQIDESGPYSSKFLTGGRRARACFYPQRIKEATISSVSSSTDICVSCTTFNILAPIYKRINGEDCRESQFRDFWLARNEKILEMLCRKYSSIICLQEFWLGNNELVWLYERHLGSSGYEMYQLARTNNKGDGLFTAIRKDQLKVLDYQEILFLDWSDRVSQLFHLKSLIPIQLSHQMGHFQEMLLVNTHLLFPHDSSCCLIRLQQAFKILDYLEHYRVKKELFSLPVILCGDWNGSKRGQVYKLLRSQGFISSYDMVHQYSDDDVDAHRWVSHHNHRGNVCGVDFIWLLNPSKRTCTLVESWKQVIFDIVKSKLRNMGFKRKDIHRLFNNKSEDNITLLEILAALKQLALTQESEGLDKQEIEDLMLIIDVVGDNLVSHEKSKVLAQNLLEKTFEGVRKSTLVKPSLQITSTPLSYTLKEVEREVIRNEFEVKLDIKDAFLYPPEVEQGKWPENYSLSDHAPLTAVFCPVYSERPIVG